MPRISYVDPSTIVDAELAGYLEHARRHGTPRPESQAIRAHVPAVLQSFSQTWEAVFRRGVCDHTIKELCRVYVSRSIDCGYWGDQRSVRAGQKGLTEEKYLELLEFESSERFDEREKAALGWTRAIVWDSDLADDALWESLHRHFSEPELVELGFFIAITLGQQRWIKTLGIGHGEVLGDTDAGLARHGIGATTS
jgi:alkylhydroperoxidase family enzyme